jgi:pyruvate dehydrogenase E1 component beta subunit
MTVMREISYGQALNEATRQLMESDERVLIVGQGVTSPWYVGMTTQGLLDRFGNKRVIDTPVSEDSVTGMAVGAAIADMRPILVHPRMDFALLAMEQLVGQAANWHYMSGGRVSVPLTARLIVNRGGEQAAQHSQSLQALFAHFPGLKVVMPSTPYDAKGLLIASVYDGNPVILIEDRWLYNDVGPVPEQMYQIPIGRAVVRRKGSDVTVVTSSYMAAQAQQAAEQLEKVGIDAEVIDLRTVKPIDVGVVIASVKKTGAMIVADGGWASCGVSAEVAALVAESDAIAHLRVPVRRLALPPAPAPMSRTLEQAYYLNAESIVIAARDLLEGHEFCEHRRSDRGIQSAVR